MEENVCVLFTRLQQPFGMLVTATTRRCDKLSETREHKRNIVYSFRPRPLTTIFPLFL